MSNRSNPDVSNMADAESMLEEEALRPLPRKRGEPVFQDSWEAEAYAIGNILVKQGIVTCSGWMDLMGSAIRKAQAQGDPDTGETYYNHWCSALESLCFQQSLIEPDKYQDLLRLWGQAIANTPHGVALSLENVDLTVAGDVGDDAHTHDDTHTHTHTHTHSHSHSHSDCSQPPQHYWTPIHITSFGHAHSDG
jgi:nitrile hydratase accessory protein